MVPALALPYSRDWRGLLVPAPHETFVMMRADGLFVTFTVTKWCGLVTRPRFEKRPESQSSGYFAVGMVSDPAGTVLADEAFLMRCGLKSQCGNEGFDVTAFNTRDALLCAASRSARGARRTGT